MNYLLDTDTLIDILENRGATRSRITALIEDGAVVALCAITIAEWFHNAVGAVAESDNNHAGSGFGYAWKADGSPDMQGATQRAGDEAVKTCTAIGGTNCKVVYTVDAGTVAHG